MYGSSNKRKERIAMNQVWLNGRLASDPEGGESGNGVAYAKFAVALEKGSGDNKEVSYLDCVCFRQQADFVRQYFTKGAGINVIGSISVRDWTDSNGVKHRKYEILVSQVSFPVTGRSRSGGGQGGRDGGGNGGRDGGRNGEPRDDRAPAGAATGAAGAAGGDGREPWDE